ncbi:hypothetical protein GCM10018987_64830 [Streptomyces cremeus]
MDEHEITAIGEAERVSLPAGTTALHGDNGRRSGPWRRGPRCTPSPNAEHGPGSGRRTTKDHGVGQSSCPADRALPGLRLWCRVGRSHSPIPHPAQAN